MDIGAQLRTAREAKGLSIGTVSQRTRVPARALSAIERNDRTALPPPAFSRGFVRTYAEEVDLDPESLVRDYFAQFPEQAVAPPTISVRKLPDASWQEPSRWGGMASAVAILLAVVVAAAVLGRRSETGTELTPVGTTGDSAAPAAPAPATPAIERSGGNACSAGAAGKSVGAAHRRALDVTTVLGCRDSRWAAHDIQSIAGRRDHYARW